MGSSWFDLLFVVSIVVSVVYFIIKKFARKKEKETPLPRTNFVGASVDYNYDRNGGYEDSLWWLQDGEGEPNFQSSLQSFLNFLGSGWIAPAPCIQLLLFSFGAGGLLVSFLFRQFYQHAFLYSSISFVLALLFSIFFTRSMGRFFWWKVTRNSRKSGELIGCEGQAMHKVTLESGMAQIYDDRGKLHRIYCRIEPDGHDIQEGDRLLVVGYDSHENRYLVKRNSP